MFPQSTIKSGHLASWNVKMIAVPETGSLVHLNAWRNSCSLILYIIYCDCQIAFWQYFLIYGLLCTVLGFSKVGGWVWCTCFSSNDAVILPCPTLDLMTSVMTNDSELAKRLSIFAELVVATCYAAGWRKEINGGQRIHYCQCQSFVSIQSSMFIVIKGGIESHWNFTWQAKT